MKKLFSFTDFLFESEKTDTDYGIYSEGSSPFVIVAPHAVEEDDEHTKEIAEELSKNLNAFCVINNKFHKPCKEKCEFDADFNKLPWNGHTYQWDDTNKPLEEFYDKIEEFAHKANGFSKDNNKRCLVLFIHGLKHDDIDIDLGAGAKTAPNMIINAEQHEKSKGNNGDVTAPIGFLEEFRDKLKKQGLNIGTGDAFSAWSAQNGSQYLLNKGVDCYCVQLEINSTLRKDPVKTAEAIAEAVESLKQYGETVLNPIEQK